MPSGLLRGHVVHRAHDRSGNRHPRCPVDLPDESEVDEDGAAGLAIEEDISRLDVAVDQPLGMGRAQSGQALVGNSGGFFDGQSAVGLQAPCQRHSVDVLHGEEVMAGIFADEVHGDDVRVTDSGGGGRFGPESPHEIRVTSQFLRQDLDGHVPLEHLVVALVDVAHSPPADPADDAEVPQLSEGEIDLRGAGPSAVVDGRVAVRHEDAAVGRGLVGTARSRLPEGLRGEILDSVKDLDAVGKTPVRVEAQGCFENRAQRGGDPPLDFGIVEVRHDRCAAQKPAQKRAELIDVDAARVESHGPARQEGRGGLDFCGDFQRGSVGKFRRAGLEIVFLASDPQHGGRSCKPRVSIGIERDAIPVDCPV